MTVLNMRNFQLKLETMWQADTSTMYNQKQKTKKETLFKTLPTALSFFLLLR